MKRSHARRLLSGLQALAAVATVVALIHCGGGTNPPAATLDETVDSGKANADGGTGITFPDVDLNAGITFGEAGLTDCGKQAAAKTITMQNASDDVVNYNATLSVGATFYTVTPITGGIPAHGQATLTVTPTPIPALSDVTPDLYAGTLDIETPGHGIPTEIHLHQTARGAIVTLAGGGTFALGSVKVGQTNTVPVNLSNAGNLEVTATLTLGTQAFNLGATATTPGTSTVPVKLTPGVSEATPLELAPTTAGTLTDTLAISFNSSAVHCGAPPTSAAVTGTGTTSVGISAGVLDFGRVNCGTTAVAQSLVVSSTIAMNFTPVLLKGALSAYTLASVANAPVASGNPIAVAAASSYTLQVVPKKVDPVSSTVDDAFGDTLTITTDVPGDTPHSIDLRQTAQGAVLKFDQSTVTVTGPVGQAINTNFNLVNTGNAQVPYSITTTPGATFSSTITTGNAIVGSTAGVLQSKAPTQSGSIVTGTMSVALGAGGGILCGDLPPAVPLSVTGTGSAITVNPSNLNFGLVDCGKTAPTQTVTLSSTVATNIKVSLGLGASSGYTLADSTGTNVVPLNSNVTVVPGTPYVLSVVPKAVPIPSSIAPNGFGDTLTLTSDIVTEPVRTVALTETAHGAIYTFPTSVSYKTGSTGTFSIGNSGNATGRYIVSSSGPTLSGNPPNVDLLPNASENYVVTGSGGSITVASDPDTTTWPICAVPGNASVTNTM